ncbi:MAG TPA: hypothetical protein VEI73_12685 [Candidatus Acidoferrum sp.]|nr:hypothetical protein [Candidatus Acidoferrum sp.]
MLTAMDRQLPLTAEEIVERAERRRPLREKTLLLIAAIALVLDLLFVSFLLLLR